MTQLSDKKKLLFIGAGAIGRGFLPWLFDPEVYDFIFVDNDKKIIDAMIKNKSYKTYRVKDDEYQAKSINIYGAYTPDNFDIKQHKNIIACFYSVGPRNVPKASTLMVGTNIPLILCENEPDCVNTAKTVVGHELVYFAVPDVITSNTAPEEMLKDDPLSIITEDGVLFIQEGPEVLEGDFKFLSENEIKYVQWVPKLYLHNTPHCITAYLGALIGATYVHEPMEIKEFNDIVEGTMNEMLESLKKGWDIPKDFLDWYAEKELARFRNKLLFDPIARVAREPLRKLGLEGRLIGAAQICLSHGVMPNNLLLGIAGALLFEDQKDPDRHLAFLKDTMPKEAFNTYILGLRGGEPLDLMLREKIDDMTAILQNFQK
tara:strand:- start:1425 stop:2546 length:1122 start_codon:yes stop_codon:yes gene_type:complete